MFARRSLLSLLLVALILPAASAQDSPGSGEESARKPSALGVRQERVKRMMKSLDDKFKELAAALEKAEPERAKKLISALQQSKQLLIEKRMDEIIRLLVSNGIN